MSFSEWIAQSISPASRASSISLVNRPLPPISSSRRSCTRSPVVVMTISGAAASTCAGSLGSAPSAAAMRRCMMPAWASESLEPRAPDPDGRLRGHDAAVYLGVSKEASGL